MRLLKKWVSEQCAVTGIEYSFLAGFIALAIMSAVFLTGDSLYNMYDVLNSFMAGNIANN